MAVLEKGGKRTGLGSTSAYYGNELNGNLSMMRRAAGSETMHAAEATRLYEETCKAVFRTADDGLRHLIQRVAMDALSGFVRLGTDDEIPDGFGATGFHLKLLIEYVGIRALDDESSAACLHFLRVLGHEGEAAELEKRLLL